MPKVPKVHRARDGVFFTLSKEAAALLSRDDEKSYVAVVTDEDGSLSLHPITVIPGQVALVRLLTPKGGCGAPRVSVSRLPVSVRYPANCHFDCAWDEVAGVLRVLPAGRREQHLRYPFFPAASHEDARRGRSRIK